MNGRDLRSRVDAGPGPLLHRERRPRSRGGSAFTGGTLSPGDRRVPEFARRAFALAAGGMLLAALHAAPGACAAPIAPAPASGLTAADVPNDAGRAVTLRWARSPDDSAGRGLVTAYVLERAFAPGGPWSDVDTLAAGTDAATDRTVARGTPYFYRVSTLGPGGRTPAGAVAGPAIARATWFNTTRGSVLAFLVLFFALVLGYMSLAHSGRRPFVRRLRGIDAIEEAVGRATEMGRPVLYVPGIQDIDEIQTVASLVVLESVAKMTARYATPIRVPVAYPIPFTIAQETVRASYQNAGVPDAVEPDAVRFVSPEQFAYVAAITGIILRDRPAAHLFLGSFYGESLMLAETGYSTGAIQVAGTANVHQLPFFVVACDHTLIGEELFAASAYLSGDPRLVGGLKGADVVKLVIVGLVLLGCALETAGIHGFTDWMRTQ